MEGRLQKSLAPLDWSLMMSGTFYLSSTYSRMNGWSINSVILFATIIKIIHVAEKLSMNQLIERLEKRFSAKIVYFKVKAFLQIKETITRKISILVLLYFMFIFIESVVAVVRLNNSQNSSEIPEEKFLAKTFLLEVLFMIIDMIYLVSLTTKLCQKSRQDLEELESKIVLTQDTKEWNFVLDKIKTAQHFEYQAFDCFPINKQILAAFTASLITFTVLFAQLVSSNKT